MRVQSRIFAGSSPKHRRTFRDRAPILFASTAAALTTALTMRQRSHTSQDASRLEIPAFGYTMRFFLQRREALEPAGLAHGPFYFGAAIAWLLGLTADAPAKQSSWKRACRCTGAALAAEMQHASVRHVEHVNFSRQLNAAIFKRQALIEGPSLAWMAGFEQSPACHRNPGSSMPSFGSRLVVACARRACVGCPRVWRGDPWQLGSLRWTQDGPSVLS